MLTRFVCSLTAAGLVLLLSTCAVGYDDKGAATDEWTGRLVMAKSPGVALREAPDENAATIPMSLTGIWLDVQQRQGDWLNVDGGWLLISDAVRDEGVVEHLTAQLKRGESVFSYLGRARGWLNQNDIDKARADVSEALRIEPQSARAYFVQGRIAAEQKSYDEALANYERALGLAPRDAVVLGVRGELLLMLHENDRAVRDFDAAIEVYPAYFRYWAARGWCRSQKGELEKALDDLAEAVRRNPRDGAVHALRAAVLLERRDFDQALTEAQEALRLAPKLAEGFAVRGAAFTSKGKLDEALSDLNEAIRLQVADWRTYAYRAYVHHAKGNFDAAVLDYTQAISLNGDDADLYFRRAEVWAAKRDNANAIADLGECIRLAPQAVEAYVHRGRLRTELQADGTMPDPARLDEALDDFQQALRLNPRHVDALIHRAYVWSAKNEPQKAMDDLAAAISINPNSSESYRQRAGIYSSRREFDLAIEDLTAGIRAEPAKIDCLLDRAVAYALKGEYQKAVDDCHAVLKMQPNNKIAYCHIAMACSWGDRNDEALEAYSAVLRIDPDDAGALLSRGNVAVESGKFEMALADFERLLHFEDHKFDAYRARGQLWLEQQKWDKALADLNESLRLTPDDEYVLCHRARCWIGLKQFDKAIEDADEALRLDPKSDFATMLREYAVRGKNDPSSSTDPFSMMANGDIQYFTADSAAPFSISYYIKLQGPAGLELAFESSPEQFGPKTLPVPHRFAMIDHAMERFQLVRRESPAAKALYARLDSGQLSKDDADIVMKAAPSLPLTADDLDRVSSGTDVIKLLVLVRDKNEQAGKPEFEVLTSTPTEGGPELVADAERRGAVIAALVLSQRLPVMRPLLHPPFYDRCVRFSLGGPEGLMVVYESAIPGTFDRQPQPCPAEFAILPGVGMRFQLTRAPAPGGAPLHALVSVSRAWPTELGPPGKTELHLKFSEADLEAAAAGTPVTHVVYWAKEVTKDEPPRFETLKSTAMPPDGDPVAEASRRGQVLATVKLTKELPAVQHQSALLQLDAGALLTNAIDRAVVEPAAAEGEMTQMLFLGPKGMTIQWDVAAPGKFDSDPLIVPGRCNFPRGAIYRLKASQIPGHEGAEIYPTLEIAPTLPRAADYLAANSVPLELSAQDIDYVLSGKLLTKVVFLPDVTDPDAPKGVYTLVSSRLDPGLDPICEADRLGTILAILRVGLNATPTPDDVNQAPGHDDRRGAAEHPPAARAQDETPTEQGH